MGREYDINLDYTQQLKELRDEEFDLEAYQPPKDYAIVKLFYFEPRDKEETDSAILVPDAQKVLTGNWGAADVTKKYSDASKAEGARAIVRVIKHGGFSRPEEPLYADILEKLKDHKIWRVTPNEVEGASMNPDFQYEASETLEKNTKTGKAAIEFTNPKMIPSWQKFWKQYIFVNPLRPVYSGEFEYLFEIPLRKLKGALKI